jgi:Rrf2 family protein
LIHRIAGDIRTNTSEYLGKGRMLTKTTHYALWVLAALSKNSPKGYIRSQELASRLRIPGPYLAKVLYSLSLNDVVESVRGRTGGYRLKRPAESLTLTTLLEIFEPESLLRVCVVGNPQCPGSSCSRHRKWQEVQDEFFAVMNETTIADIA